MIGKLHQMLTCHWSGRHIQRYLDADPAALLSTSEISRLEGHLATCEKCTQVTHEFQALRRALSRWSGGTAVDPESIDRVKDFLARMQDDTPA